MTELYNILYSPDHVFTRTAFLVSALASLSLGIIGTFVVVRRIGYIAGAVAHCAFGGIGIGLFLRQLLASGALKIAFLVPLAVWIDPIFVAVIVAVFSALLIGAVQMYGKEREDSIIGAIWSIGMAVGLLFLDKTDGYYSVSSYLFGSVLLVSWTDVLFVGGLGLFVPIIVVICFRQFQAVCFDEEFAKLRGISTGFYFQFLLVLTAITVVLMIRVVGIILVIAMLTLPAATAGRLTKRLLPMMILAVFICFACSWVGIYLSVAYNFSAEPMMILVAGAVYSFVLGSQKLVLRRVIP